MQTDYIIVGGGSAGCVLANRLSENPNVHVTLIEAGGEDWNPLIHIPAGYIKTMVNPKVNWMFDTAPDARTADRKIAMPRGKVLGGSSAINTKLVVSSQSEDYDAWAARGNAGWSYLDVLPYFKKSENCQIASLQEPGDMQFRGADGPLKVNAIRSTYPILDRLMESAQSLQFPINADYNGQMQEGFGYYQLTQSHGLRFSAKKAYLAPVRRRSNLTVLSKCQVIGLDIDSNKHLEATSLHMNDIGIGNISTTSVIAFDAYDVNRQNGAFILIDRATNLTVGAGMIRHGLRRFEILSRVS